MNSSTLYYKLSMPIIPCLIYITLGKDMLERAAKQKGLIEEPFVREFLSGDTLGGGLMPLEGCRLWMILPEEWDAEIVYHEALHAASRMWYDVGADLKVPRNDEVLTYTQGYIANYIKEVCYGD